MVAPEVKQSADENEITKTCAVLGCEEFKHLEGESFFRFPEDPSLRQIWTDLTGRNNWTPTDYSYICMHHFSIDCFMCDEQDIMVLVDKAIPSLKLPRHVLEVEYIDEETLDNDDEYMNTDEEEEKPVNGTHVDVISKHIEADSTYMYTKNTLIDANSAHFDANSTQFDAYSTSIDANSTHFDANGTHFDANSTHVDANSTHVDANSTHGDANSTYTDVNTHPPSKELENIELLKLFTVVQRLQRQAVGLKSKLKYNMRVHNRQNRFLLRIKEIIERKKKILNQKRKKKCRILLSLQDKIKEDTTGLVLALPMRHSEDMKNFALSVYKYSPQAYIYIRNTLRTMLPSTEVLDTWVSAGYQPRNVLASNSMIKVVAEQTETQLSCKVMIG